LRVPSPCMATMSMFAGSRRFKPSIPGYGTGFKKVIRRSDAGVNQSSSPRSVGQGFHGQDGCTIDLGLHSSKLSSESDAAIPVSLVGFPSHGLATILT
jgi:hypothetical protein